MTEDRDWGEVFRLIEQTLVSEAVESSAGAFEPDLDARREAVRSALADASALTLDPSLPDDDFWAATALKPFYAGTKSVVVEKFHNHMMMYLRDWSTLIGPEWRPSDRKGHGGAGFEAFLEDTDCFQNRPRLTHTINAAVGLGLIKKHFPDRRFMQHFLRVGGDGTTVASQKKIYANLRQHLSMTEVATYHLMMELGFPLIKPDRVVNRVAIRLGLVEWTGSDGRPLPPRSPARDTDVLGANEAFAWEFQSVIQRIAASTGLSVRKIDYLLVKLGQEVSTKQGLFRRNICAMTAPQCNLCRASVLCRYPNRSELQAA